MRFFITRTSRADNDKPCEEAFADTYTVQERYPVDDPRKLPVYHGNPTRAIREWKAKGSNHRVEHGCIVRDMQQEKAWFIDLASLDDLRPLIAKYGDLLIAPHYPNIHELQIEIYDEYDAPPQSVQQVQTQVVQQQEQPFVQSVGAEPSE